MKICILASDFAPRVGGISTFATDLARSIALQTDVSMVAVLVFQGETAVDATWPLRLSVRYFPKGSVWRLFCRLLRELPKSDCDIFYSPNIFPLGFFTLLIGRYLLRKPVVVTFYGTDVLSREASRATRIALAFTLRFATAAVTISRSTATLAAARYHLSAERFPVIYYSLPPLKEQSGKSEMRNQYGFLAGDIVLLSVAQLIARKGIDDLLRALALIPDPRIKLLVAGDGPERVALETLKCQLGLESRVCFAGRVADLGPLYRDADIFVLSSYYDKARGDVEGLGIVFLEAAQHGLPVVGTRSGGIPETMLEGETGLLVPERDSRALAAALERLIGDREERRQMGARGKRFVEERFSSEANTKRYVGLFRSSSNL